MFVLKIKRTPFSQLACRQVDMNLARRTNCEICHTINETPLYFMRELSTLSKFI